MKSILATPFPLGASVHPLWKSFSPVKPERLSVVISMMWLSATLPSWSVTTRFSFTSPMFSYSLPFTTVSVPRTASRVMVIFCSICSFTDAHTELRGCCR